MVAAAEVAEAASVCAVSAAVSSCGRREKEREKKREKERGRGRGREKDRKGQKRTEKERERKKEEERGRVGDVQCECYGVVTVSIFRSRQGQECSYVSVHRLAIQLYSLLVCRYT